MQGITVRDAAVGLVVARIMTGSAVEKQGDPYNKPSNVHTKYCLSLKYPSLEIYGKIHPLQR